METLGPLRRWFFHRRRRSWDAWQGRGAREGRNRTPLLFRRAEIFRSEERIFTDEIASLGTERSVRLLVCSRAVKAVYA